jgi:hypothetical protein
MLVAMLSFSATGLLADYFPAMRKGRNYLRGKAETARKAFSIGCHFLSSLFSQLPAANSSAELETISNPTYVCAQKAAKSLRLKGETAISK